VDAGRLVIALGALVLLVSLFLDWYGSERGGAAITAWTSFELVDLLLAALAVGALLAVVEGIALPGRDPSLPPGLRWFAGPFALIVVLVSIINPPPLTVGFGFNPTLEPGIWIGLAGALLMTIGIGVSMLRISVVVGPRERDRTHADPAAETRTMRTEPGPTPPSAADPRVPPPG
jgi:hypothetical protein